MIIRCPECSTGFELPDDRVTAEGTKLKCSKCEHVFRVRDDDGEPEIFYKSGDRRDREQERDEDDDSNPFPHAGMDLEPKKESAFGDLDADEDEMAAFQSAFDEDEEDGEGAEDDGPADFVETNRPPGAGGGSGSTTEVDDSPNAGGAAVAVAETEDQEQQDEAVLGAGTESTFGDPADHVDDSFGEDGAYFDPDEGKVDDAGSSASPANSGPGGGPGAVSGNGPSPGGGPSGGPPNSAGGPPPGASGPPPTAGSGGPPQTQGPQTHNQGVQNGASGSPAGVDGSETGGRQGRAPAAETSSSGPQVAASADSWDDELEPHNIGGSTGQKVVTVLLLLSFVVMGFTGTVAYLNDGFIDFQAAPEMIEVAFGDGEYEPREEWTGGSETKVVAPTEPVVVEGVHAQLVDLGRAGELFVVQGMVRNHDEESVHDIDLRAMLMTPEERSIREIRQSLAGGDVSIGDIRDLRSGDDVDELISGDAVTLEPGQVERFTMVFEELPQRVQDGEHFTYRVEVADKEQS